jgi:hypothetical protein
MSAACGRYSGEDKYVQPFGREASRKEVTFKIKAEMGE